MGSGMDTPKQAQVALEAGQQAYAGKRIHMIGICGAGMRALAKMLLERQAVISGSDRTPGGAAERLREQGAAIHTGQRAENLPEACDLVVYSAAIHEQNPELLAARRRGLEVLKYCQMLGRLMAQRVGIAVAGTHGKSTTTAMVAYVLHEAGLQPSFVIGATVPQLGGPSGVGAGRHFVAEACEYDRSFLSLHPHLAAILNVEEDHLDCYADIHAIVEAFRAFAALVPADGVLVANGDDRYTRSVLEARRAFACEVETFGLSEGCAWQAQGPEMDDQGRYHAAVLLRGEPFCRLDVPLPGAHNLFNALAAAALLHHAGLAGEAIAERLKPFQGALRRMTLKGRAGDITVLDDYAHHPTEISATLKAVRDHYKPRRLLCVFQPHQHSRTRFLLKDFAGSFNLADEVIVPDIYFVRDSELEKQYISSRDLVAQIRLNGGAARYVETFDEIVGDLKDRLRAGDLVVTMGAGNIWEVADEIVRWLGEDR
jgi:UDP-N-acetylmuramate--alanine ligase